MSMVTKRINEIKQPKGGYISPSLFEIYDIDDSLVLNETENVHATVTGLAVDYLTRFVMGTNVRDAFEISCIGAVYAEKMFGIKGAIEKAAELLSGIKGLDNQSIINACKMVTYDV